MTKANDPALYESAFERIEKDRYWTHPWLVSALLNRVETPDVIWEPAAGRGDIVSVMLDYGKEVVASDIDLSEFDPLICPWRIGNFFDEVPDDEVTGIITNPPYNQPRGVAEKFVRHAIDLMAFTNVEFVAMLLRSEFKHGKRRKDLFGECNDYYGELVLTERPRWDWWFRDEPEASPRHNFSWFIWERDYREGLRRNPVQLFHYRERKK